MNIIRYISLVAAIGLLSNPVSSFERRQVISLPEEHLRVVFSKIAPLERWESSWHEFRPTICWKFFRAGPEKVLALLNAMDSFQGHNKWDYPDRCLQPAGNRKFIAPGRTGAFTSSPPLTAVRPTNRDEIFGDLEGLAEHIERLLELKAIDPKPFSEKLLAKEALRLSHGPFEDFVDGGQRIAYLIVEPGDREVFDPTEKDISLHFEPGYDEMPAISGDIVGADLSKRGGGSLTDQEAEKIEREFPLFWKISEYYDDAYLSPLEAEQLARECAALDKIVSSPKALRGLDKMARIANWAAAKHYGVLFSAP